MAPFTVSRYGSDPSQYVELWDRPTGASQEPALGTAVLIHGGYWRDRYSCDLMHPMAAHLITGGWAVANIEYRRLQEPPPNASTASTDTDTWEYMSADVIAAITAGTTDASGPVIVIGHSAGGHLALWAGAASDGALDGVVALAPVADLETADQLSLSDGVVRRLLGGPFDDQADRYRAASPKTLIPLGVPQLVVHGDADENVPQEISIEYCAAAQAAGDQVALLDPADVDHFQIIDPAHEVWRPIDRWLSDFAPSSTGD